MNKKLFYNGIIVFIVSCSLIISSYILGNSIRSITIPETNKTGENSKVLNLNQVAKYLNMTEEEVKSIIETENNRLATSNTFSGKMFPYFVVDNNQYFYIDEIDEWLKEVSSNRRVYDTIEGYVD